MDGRALTTLEILEAEREIHRTHFRFFQLADRGDYARLGAECFAPDVDIEYTIMPGPPQRFSSRDGFTSFMLAGSPRIPDAHGPAVAHVAAQSSITWDEGRPHLSGYATVWHWAATRTPSGRHRPADWTTVGRVEDDYARIDGKWLITRRRVSPAAGLVATGAAPGLGRPTASVR
ncbi:nuclear transport factor 2 family protein [Actinocorallia sp. API 0066]|uniref:nuclear transport factor 2 family protein n=1 Tax=Actinocorallia sp. API 0066 TaxID=2896846 RepID=UPI001E4A0E90|nr:nuclear transport factor 2 family protein [Actinocorallia sp. API 0066]MCD0450921.1 nuclear transport factor 2 family protein [Actinocorallia sp. API 0066]